MKAQCPECKKPFSIKEHICPHCGYTLTNSQYKFRVYSWRFLCCSIVLLALVIFIVKFTSSEPVPTTKDMDDTAISVVVQEEQTSKSKTSKPEIDMGTWLNKKVQNEAGRDWAMRELYSGMPWDYELFTEKMGNYDNYDTENSKIKMRYFPEVDITLEVNNYLNKLMTWHPGKVIKKNK